jgi:hypothetical protein
MFERLFSVTASRDRKVRDATDIGLSKVALSIDKNVTLAAEEAKSYVAESATRYDIIA